MRRVFPVAIAVLVLTGCVAAPPSIPAATPPESGPASTGAVSALPLVNLWRVTEADGSGDEAYLRLDGRDLTVWTACGVATGDWRAAGGAFLADVSGGLGTGCLTENPAIPVASLEWLYAARGFRLVDDAAEVELLDSDGAVVAVLRVDGAPPANDSISDDYLRAPEVTPEIEALFAEAAPLPDGVEPADAAALVGRWEPAGDYSPDQPFVELAEDGSWTGSDGCNGGSGRWVVGDDGRILATAGPSTLIGCDGAAVPNWLAAASTAGLTDSQLVFFDTAGIELGRVAPS
ncbi:hypothetical protein HD599_002192 [Conyzicola lurida]|uniref:META domain-containing protein n=1 Tax=Conyzicola lurida TaxID=1172621 RepID=A0A841AR21_9MICO|nr:META domain-containing protein [Conyzicola lurida]MBB5843869.1 hypothetical protein [Conyzicola lurida]